MGDIDKWREPWMTEPARPAQPEQVTVEELSADVRSGFREGGPWVQAFEEYESRYDALARFLEEAEEREDLLLRTANKLGEDLQEAREEVAAIVDDYAERERELREALEAAEVWFTSPGA